MADVSSQERLQPFLLDRITDRQPEARQESRERRILSPQEYRAAILRDLGWLLNSEARPPDDQPERFPEAAKSVLNYGMPPLAGSTSSIVSPQNVEKMVKQAILRFEPRVLRHSLKVTAVQFTGEAAEGANVIELEIRGEVWNMPVPETLYIRTEVDLESGKCALKDQQNRPVKSGPES